jgi:hypothetical protein
MKSSKYKYDVAFAFSKNDEHLANQLNDLLHDNLKTFLYPKKLEEIDRTNRELKIMDAIEKHSKMIVVLFRKKWGNSPWTKIEELAIRKRAAKEGYDSLLFIPLDHPPTVPKYVPKEQVWKELGDSGIKGAALVIEERFRLVQNTNNKKFESAIDQDATHRVDDDSDKSIIMDAVNTLEIAMLELNDLFFELKNYKTKIEKDRKGIIIDFHQKHKTCILHHGVFSIKFHLQTSNNKATSQSKLYYELQKQDTESNEPNILTVEVYQFEAKKSGEYGWMKDIGTDLFISSKKLAEKSINTLLSQSTNHKK